MFGWTTPAGMQYLTRSGSPLLRVADLPWTPTPDAPANPDVALLDAAQRDATPVLVSAADLTDPGG